MIEVWSCARSLLHFSYLLPNQILVHKVRNNLNNVLIVCAETLWNQNVWHKLWCKTLPFRAINRMSWQKNALPWRKAVPDEGAPTWSLLAIQNGTLRLQQSHIKGARMCRWRCPCKSTRKKSLAYSEYLCVIWINTNCKGTYIKEPHGVNDSQHYIYRSD